MSEAIVFTSGKGGVGKTTVISNIGVELSQLDKKVIMLDTDMGLRNLDLVMGIEDKVNYNILDILNRSCRIRQAIIRNKKYPNLYVIPAAPSMDTLCSYEARFKILIEELKASFDYCLIDSPVLENLCIIQRHLSYRQRNGLSDRIYGQIQEQACFWPHGQVFLCSGK